MPLSRLDASNRVRFSNKPRWLLQATGEAFHFKEANETDYLTLLDVRQ